jgi:hypothetical protein
MGIEQIVGYIVAAAGAIGLKELVAMFYRSKIDSSNRAEERKDKIVDQNYDLLKSTLDELKDELREKREIENQLRERVSDCTARLDMIMKELYNEDG